MLVHVTFKINFARGFSVHNGIRTERLQKIALSATTGHARFEHARVLNNKTRAIVSRIVGENGAKSTCR